jgi:hypothetical protein
MPDQLPTVAGAVKYLRTLRDPGNVTGDARDPRWATFLKRWLPGKRCRACGAKDGLTGHHIIPVHKARAIGRPELELDPNNVTPLCLDRCHIVHGHCDDYQLDNPNVLADCDAHFARRQEAIAAKKAGKA